MIDSPTFHGEPCLGLNVAQRALAHGPGVTGHRGPWQPRSVWRPRRRDHPEGSSARRECRRRSNPDEPLDATAAVLDADAVPVDPPAAALLDELELELEPHAARAAAATSIVMAAHSLRHEIVNISLLLRTLTCDSARARGWRSCLRPKPFLCYAADHKSALERQRTVEFRTAEQGAGGAVADAFHQPEPSRALTWPRRISVRRTTERRRDRMDFGLGLLGYHGCWDDAAFAEQHGFSSAGFVDSPLLGGDPFVCLGLAAQATRAHARRNLSGDPRPAPGGDDRHRDRDREPASRPAAPSSAWGPGFTGRAVFGLPRVGPTRLREYASQCRALLHGEAATHREGRHEREIRFRHTEGRYVDTDAPVPVYVAADGPQGARRRRRGRRRLGHHAAVRRRHGQRRRRLPRLPGAGGAGGVSRRTVPRGRLQDVLGLRVHPRAGRVGGLRARTRARRHGGDDAVPRLRRQPADRRVPAAAAPGAARDLRARGPAALRTFRATASTRKPTAATSRTCSRARRPCSPRRSSG